MTDTPLGTGTITRDGTGAATFLVRGEMRLAWMRQDTENATLRISWGYGSTECAMAWVYKRQDEDGVPVDWCWSGQAIIEGYTMNIEGRRNGDILSLEFTDAIQPYQEPVEGADLRVGA